MTRAPKPSPQPPPRLEALESRRLLSAGNGLSAAYFDGLSPAGTPAHAQVDSSVNFDWGTTRPAGVKSSQFSAVWTGQIEPLFSENYTFTLHSDSARMWINGKQIINSWLGHAQPADDASAPIALQAGTRYDIRIEYFHRANSTDAAAQLQWQSPSQPLGIVPPTQLFALDPFASSPATTEQRIQAEDFDTGAAGVAYYDTTPGNAGGAYRSTDVDISPTSDSGGGFQVSSVAPGEWLDYSLKVPAAGLYYLDVRLAARGQGGALHAEIDGINITGKITVPNTGSWNTFQTVTVGGISLTPGWHVLRLVSDTAGKSGAVANYNWLELRQEFLTPGTGFLAPTLQPANMGAPTSFGYADKAIARWDVVPYQTFTGNFNVGVVAFHNSGIDHVSFSVNGGAWVNVSQMTLNPQTGVNEYWATLRASDFNDGQLEIRAIAYPKVGVPRVLQGTADTGNGEVSMFLNADAHGTLPTRAVYVSTTGSDTSGDGSAANPFASVVKAALSIQAAQGSVDGGVIYLMAGSYTIKAAEWDQGVTTTTRWLTITRAPGTAQSDVVIAGTAPNNNGNNDGMMTNLVRVYGITLSGLVMGSTHNTDSIWYDNINLAGPGRTAGFTFSPVNFQFGYITDSTISDVQDAVDGFNFCRNVQVHRVAQLSFYNTPLVINSSVTDSDRGTNTALHPDVFFMYGTPVNVICYGITATESIDAFGLRFQQSATDVAVVDCQISVTTPFNFQMERPYQNMLIADSSLLGAPTSYQGTFSAVDIVFDDVTFAQSPGPHDGVTFR